MLRTFFQPAMVAHPRSYSPSAGKPAAVVAHLASAGIPLEVVPFAPVTRTDLARVHERAYVDAVLDLRAPNGFGDRSREVAGSLLHTTGSLLAAARDALARRAVAFSPTSGFHHASPGAGDGFCTFNGLVVTAAALRAEGLVRRVGIVDCDYHYGDGTDACIAALSVGGWIRHFTAGARYARPADTAAFLAELPSVMATMRDCDLVLYQAGADAHVDDPLGGFLTNEQLARRDAIVFREARRLGVPVAWNLAGGYQRGADGSIAPVLAIHEATARACLEAWSAGS
jgi:acetoin utilization deacetylase AcuC-like enzyme